MAEWGPASEIAGLFSLSSEDEPPPLDEDEPPPLDDEVPAPAARTATKEICRAVDCGCVALIALGIVAYIYMHGGNHEVAKSEADPAAQANGSPSDPVQVAASKNSAVRAVSSEPQSAPLPRLSAANSKSAGTAQAQPVPAKPAPPTVPLISPIPRPHRHLCRNQRWTYRPRATEDGGSRSAARLGYRARIHTFATNSDGYSRRCARCQCPSHDNEDREGSLC